MIFYVYEHWRLDTDACFYVGKGSGPRAYQRKSRNIHWWNIVNKIERSGFGYEIRLVATGLSEEQAFALEKERITFWSEIVDLANKTLGGEGFTGGRHTAVSKEKISLSSKERAKQNKSAMSERMSGNKNPFYGKTHSDEVKDRLSRLFKGRPRTGQKPLTDDQKRAISLSLKAKGIKPPSRKGISPSLETRQKQANSLRAYWAARKAKATCL